MIENFTWVVVVVVLVEVVLVDVVLELMEVEVVVFSLAGLAVVEVFSMVDEII